MDLKVSSLKAGFSSSDYTSDPEEKEISEGEDEDDDRNHKHRRRETRSQSLEGNSLDQGLTRPYRKRSRPAENGYSFREGDPQSGDIWKPLDSEKGISSRFDKRRPNQASFSRAPSDLNQRTRGSQTMPSEVGLVRGRGREPISWAIRDSRLGLVDVASSIIQPRPVPSALFAGRGFPNISNLQNPSWNAFGLVPGVPSYGLDSLHPLGMQAAMRPAISPIVNIGIPRQRCRDFEERGFCLRGDMCPMEHGVNRIVIEDVQGLSQFNLPVSLPGSQSQLPGTSSVQGALPVISTASVSLTNNKALHSKNGKPGMTDNGFVGSIAATSDVYDPDQPLWTNDNADTATPLNQSNADETAPFPDANRQNAKSRKGFNPESQSSSMWGRADSSKPSSGENKDSTLPEQNIKSEDTTNTVRPDVPRQGKGENVDGNAPQPKQSLLKAHNDSLRNTHKHSQKALRTLFINGIPLKDNRRDSLISHFKKFGEVIDIHIPMHSERAFVQFSKKEEAEAALKAPDAVMGNRFIKLWWANRDNIPDDVKNGTNSVAVIPHRMNLNPSLSHPLVPDKGKENPHPHVGKDANASASVPQPKPMVASGPKASPPQQKKLESLEILKEQLRKKQEMLEQKRNEFRRQLDKLEKHAVGSKDDPTMKNLKGEMPPDHSKAETSKSLPSISSISTDKAEQTVAVQEPVKPSFRPPAPPGTPFVANRFKLDNRPTAFKIISPLPAGLANVAALKEHFSAYGDISSVDLEETDDATSASARISFTTRRVAEKAFLQGKCWKGEKLQFLWLTSNNSIKECPPPAAASENNLPENHSSLESEHVSKEGDSDEHQKTHSNSS